jgi:uncharacterized protein YcbK (DUF882 family)
MTQITKNFDSSEFKCRDNTEVPEELAENLILLCENLQKLRDRLQMPIRVISGYRTPEYNRKIGGAQRSQHLLAKAADITAPELTPRELWEILREMIRDGRIMKGGVGIYRDFVHYDVRGFNARWSGRGAKKDAR